MNRSRTKNVNRINAASLARWIVVTAFLAVVGLSYVYLNLQLSRLGNRKKSFEQELIALHTQNENAGVQIAALKSRSAIQRRLKEGYIAMVPIKDQSIVRLSAPPRAVSDTDIRPVSNQELGQ